MTRFSKCHPESKHFAKDRCRSCYMAEYRRVHYKANKDKYIKTSREWHIKNREKAKIQSRNHYLANKDKYKKRSRLNIISSYGMSEEDFNKMRQKQDYKCAICRKAESNKHLCIDHCHDTGKIRGLLCSPCNRSLGALGDKIETIQVVLEYLRNAAA